ncbi:uncharacterized protein BDZ99DRAFT_576968 [Mytilinidion resinicola]|uniref:Uncharacterized protein n=1 Tax=Mytilinidion resinicola TaxID=574789 RepID=A0A6A6Y134_9PEZI|nr:uncharacterized protein BDZ99DRAFT_576968 [Mytilinidion resinicola]KAF2802268.1 hypothetical protein BDZ99DRAFT_576968 [Mytilinidion resinicola]
MATRRYSRYQAQHLFPADLTKNTKIRKSQITHDTCKECAIKRANSQPRPLRQLLPPNTSTAMCKVCLRRCACPECFTRAYEKGVVQTYHTCSRCVAKRRRRAMRMGFRQNVALHPACRVDTSDIRSPSTDYVQHGNRSIPMEQLFPARTSNPNDDNISEDGEDDFQHPPGPCSTTHRSQLEVDTVLAEINK